MRSLIPTRTSRAPTGLQAAALLGVAGIAASFLYVRSRQQGVEHAHPPQGKFIDVDGVRLHYLERGEGPALVLLHGNGLMANDFDLAGLLENAARPYRVIAFDRPGFGHSERPGNLDWTPEAQARLFYKALHQLGVERPIVLGHSLGTMVALAMALEYPKYVRAISLVSGYYYPAPQAGTRLLAIPAIPGLGQLLRYTVAPLIGRMLWQRLVRRTFAPEPVPARFRQFPKWMALRPAQLGASAAEMALMQPAAARLSARYRELTMPIALIAGSGDRIIDASEHTLRLHHDIGHSDLVLEDDCGHMPHYADPARVMQALERLESSLTPGGANLRHPATVHSSVTLH